MVSGAMPVNMNGKGMVVGMNKGILFDVDGTLWDSAAQVAESWNEVLARYPHLGVRITAQDMYDNMGKTMMDIGKTLFPGLAQEECRKVMEECMTYENHYLLTHPGVLYPEAGEIMARLSRQYGLYIVSNCQSGYIEVLLESCGNMSGILSATATPAFQREITSVWWSGETIWNGVFMWAIPIWMRKRPVWPGFPLYTHHMALAGQRGRSAPSSH